MNAYRKLTSILILSILLSSACNAPWMSAGSSPTEVPASVESPSEPPADTPEVSLEPVALDPCTLLDTDEISDILGGEVQVMPAAGTGGCSYIMQGDSPTEMTQLIVSAAQGEEAKSLTLLSLGMLAGFSGDPSLQEKFEAINAQAGSLNLTEIVQQLGSLLQDAGLNVEYQEEDAAATLSVVYESEAYNQGTFIHAQNDTYVSINQVGSSPLLEESILAGLAKGAFDTLPPAFFVLDSDQDGSFQIELGDDTETETTAELGTTQPIWVTSANAGQVTAIDPNDNSILATIDVGLQPSDVVVYDGFVYVISYSEETLRKIDPNLLEVVQTIKFDGHMMHLAAGGGAVWVVGGGGVRMLDLETGTRYGVVYADCQDVVLGGGSVWVSQLGDQQILRIDPDTRKVISTVKLDGQPAELAFGLDQLWAVLHDKREVISIDPETEEIGFRLSDENTILGVATDPERIWYITPRGGMYFKPATLGKGRLINQHLPTDLLYYDGSLWVSSPDEGFVTRLDIDGKTVLADIEIGGDPHALGAPEEAGD
jgi:glutamine cyclotransferase